MLLSDLDIHTEIATGRLVIDPFDPGDVQPASVDIHLDRSFLVFDHSRCTHIDPEDPPLELVSRIDLPTGEPFVLHPGEFVLGSSRETVTIPTDLAARLEGKSSLGRLGLLTHATAGFIDPGFTGTITLELSNTATLPILLRPGMRIGQLCFFRLTSPTARPYGSPGLGSRYQGQTGPTASRSHQDSTTDLGVGSENRLVSPASRRGDTQ